MGLSSIATADPDTVTGTSASSKIRARRQTPARLPSARELMLLALVLASLGVYSVMAYSVAQRSAEIGIRMALGAGAGAVQKMVIGQGMKLAALGLAIGLAAALALTRLMEALLFEVHASDPTIYLAIAALLSAVAITACWIPSRRAAGLDPTTALHEA